MADLADEMGVATELEGEPTPPAPLFPRLLAEDDQGTAPGGTPAGQGPVTRGQKQPAVKRPKNPPPDPVLQGSAFVAAQRDHARWAKVVEMADRWNVLPDFIDRNFDKFAKADSDQQQQHAMTGISPTFANWLADPDNATLAKHEMAPLAQVDKGAKLLAPTKDDTPGILDQVGTAEATGMADLARSAGLLAAAYGLTSPTQAAKFIADMKQRGNSLREQAPDYAKEFRAAMAQHEQDVDRAGRDVVINQENLKRESVLMALRAYGASGQPGAGVAGAVGDYRGLSAALSLIGAAISRPRGLIYQGIESLASMVPMLGSAAAGGLAGAGIGSFFPVIGTGIGGLAGSIAGTFAGAAPVNVGSEIEAELEKRGVDLTDAAAVEHALSEPALMAGVRSKAEKAGLTSAGVMALFSGFSGQLAGVAERAGAGTAVRAAAKAGDVGVQAVGVAAGQEAGQVAKGDEASPGRAISTTLSMLGVGAATEAIGASRRALFHPDPVRAAEEVTRGAQDAMRSQHDAQVLAEIGQAVKEAKTAASTPERIKALVETATGGRDAATVYFQQADWDKHWQEQGKSPAQIAADVMGDGGKAYHDAVTTGSALAIPLGDYVAKVAPTEHWDGLLNIARTRLDGPTLGEAKEYLQALPATLKELADEATAPRQQTPQEASAERIRQSVEDQLLKAGISPVAAKSQAQVYEAAFRTLAVRAGMDPAALFQRYGLTIGRGETPQEVVTKLERAKAAATAATAQEAELTRARAELETAAKGAEPAVAETAKSRAKFLGGITPTFSDEAEAARFSEEEGSARAAELARPRTASGRLKNLTKATDQELANEFMLLTDANAVENVAPTSIATDYGETWTGMKPGAMKAMGRIAARAKTLAKLEAEFQRRGMDPADAYMSAYQEQRMQEPTAFPFGTLEQAQKEGGAPRGRITFGDGREFKIELLEKADRSTFLHETGHFYLEVLGDLAKAENAAPDIAADYATVREWVGAEGEKPLTVEQHEQFARGFEAYLMEGKAPSAGLRQAFFRFKNWLLGIYRNLRSLNVDLTPQVRDVFDRMLASREEIADLANEQDVAPLFDDPRAVGMNEDQAQRYAKAVSEARESAEEELTTRLMKQIRREESSEWKTWRDPIQAEETARVDASPLYQAMEAMRKGTKPDGSPLDDATVAVKLDRETVREMMSERSPAIIRKGVTATEGVHPDVAAEMFGFESGRILLDAIADAPKRDEAIRIATDARMQKEHGDRLSDVEVRELATQALHGEKRVQLLRKELEHLASENMAAFKGLTKTITKAVPPTDEIRARAAEIIGKTKVEDVRPDLFRLGATKAAREARDAFLRGDVEAAFDAKRRELLATEVYRSAANARETIDDALDQFRKVFRGDAKLADTRDLDLVNAARSVLAAFGIGRSDKPAAEYLKQMKNYDPSMYEIIEPMVQDATTNATNYKELSMEEFRALSETVQGMWELSRTTRQVEVNGIKRDRAELQDQMAQQLSVSTKGRTPREGYAHAKTGWDKAKRTLQSGKSWLTRVEHLADYLDGDNPERPFSNFLFGPVSEGATRYRVRLADVLTKYAEIVKTLEGAKSATDIEAPELNYRFKDRTELLGALLHTGNESNLRKFLLGAAKDRPAFGDTFEDGTLDTSRWDAFTARMRRDGILTKADYDYAQAVWNLLEELKPDAQRAHKQMYGRYFDEITAKAFENEFGTYKGGYYPAKADPFLVTDAQAHEDRESLLGAQNSFMFPSTYTGFTKSRVEGYTKPLIMDAALVPSHLSAVLRFAEIQPHIRDVARMVTSPQFRPFLDDLDPTLASEVLVPWLQRSAAQRSEEPGRLRWLDTAARELRNRSGLQIMFANSVVLAEQLTHFPSVVIKQGVGTRLFGSFWRYIRNPKEFVGDVHEKSAMMRTRESAALMEARNAVNKVMLDPGITTRYTDFVREHGRFLMAAVQSVMDNTTWGAAYDYATTSKKLGGLGLEEAEAIKHADSVIRTALGSYSPEDLSRFEAGTPVQRLFGMFYGFYNTKANVLGAEFAKTIRDQGLKKGAGRLLFLYTFGFMVPAVMGGAIRQAFSGKPIDHDDDGPTDDLLRLYFGSQVEMLGSAVPVVGRPAATAAVKMLEGKKLKPDDFNILTSPAVKSLEEAGAGATTGAYDLIHGQMTRQDITDVLTLIGLLTGTPARTLAKPLGYLHDVRTGKASPTGPVDRARGLLTGQAGGR